MLCDYSDAYILLKGTITVENTVTLDADANNTNKKLIFRNSLLAEILFEKYLIVYQQCPLEVVWKIDIFIIVNANMRWYSEDVWLLSAPF